EAPGTRGSGRKNGPAHKTGLDLENTGRSPPGKTPPAGRRRAGSDRRQGDRKTKGVKTKGEEKEEARRLKVAWPGQGWMHCGDPSTGVMAATRALVSSWLKLVSSQLSSSRSECGRGAS